MSKQTFQLYAFQLDAFQIAEYGSEKPVVKGINTKTNIKSNDKTIIATGINTKTNIKSKEE